MASGSLMRPAPLSPQARRPLSGPTVRTPRASKTRRFCCVASAVHMPVFIAGASTMGALVAKSVVVSMSSAMPQASLAIRLAVAGATSITSAFCAREMCLTSQDSVRAKVSTHTGRALRVSKVSGATSLVAFCVMMTSTSAPSFFSLETTSHAL